MLIILILLFAVGLVAVIIVLFLRRRNPARLTWSEVGTLIDRSLRAYRRQFVPLLALSAICAPLGVVTYSSFYSFLVTLNTPAPLHGSGDWLQLAMRIVSIGVLVMGTLGLGRTLLACGAAQALRDESEGQTVGLGRMLGQQPWRATIGLMLRMIVPSLINALFGVLGLLATLSWRVAPAALLFEQLDARDAVRHGRALVKPVRGQLADVLAPLWLIGWLIVGVPMVGGLWLFELFGALSPSAIEALTLIGWIVGSVFVAPLTALGAAQFYLFVRERSTQRMEAAIDALYGDASMARSEAIGPTTGEIARTQPS
jgi:hypothetical protein